MASAQGSNIGPAAQRERRTAPYSGPQSGSRPRRRRSPASLTPSELSMYADTGATAMPPGPPSSSGAPAAGPAMLLAHATGHALPGPPPAAPAGFAMPPPPPPRRRRRVQDPTMRAIALQLRALR